MSRQPSIRDTKRGVVRRWSLARKLVADADLPRDLIESLWDVDVERIVFSATPLQVKDRCIAARLDRPEGPFLIKRHTWGSFGRTLRSVWRTSAARSSLQLGRRLADLGIPTPRPRACLEERIGPIGYRSYLISDYVEGTSLYHFVRFHDPSREDLEQLAQQVAAIWQQFVSLGISHNDMKPENFIVDPSGRLWVIDLERVRFHHRRARIGRRQFADVRIFLHPRAWRNQRAARDVFEAAFLESAHGQLGDAISGSRIPEGSSVIERDHAAESADDAERLSVLILCDEPDVDEPQVRRTVDSVRDFADEVVLVSTSAGGRAETARRVNTGRCAPTPAIVGVVTAADVVAARLAEHPWVLILHAGEQVTPLLAIDIEETLAERAARDAYRIPVEELVLGCRAESDVHASVPVRLFHQLQCSFSVAGGALAISADPQRTGQLDGWIRRETFTDVGEYIDHLNANSTREAAQRFHDGDRPRLARATLRSLREFASAYVRRGGYQHGWAGVQLTALNALASWLEEVKLWQLAHQFQGDWAAINDAEIESGRTVKAPRAFTATEPDLQAKAA